jgi:hypothetical protein
MSTHGFVPKRLGLFIGEFGFAISTDPDRNLGRKLNRINANAIRKTLRLD